MATSSFRRIVWPLAVAETLLWASTFYVFHALLPRWEAEFGWAKTQIAGAFTVALICSAVCAPLFGRLIDRGFGRRVMGIGGVVASVALMLMAGVSELWQFYTLWLLIGVCYAAILYEPCFAILTWLYETQAKRAITLVTLFAGLAGTLSFPLAHWLSETVGWRNAMLVFAGISLVATFIAQVALYEAKPDSAPQPRNTISNNNGLRLALTTPMFWLIAMSFTMIALNHGALLPHLLPLLDERGISVTTAVFAASMIGPMQVLGRIGMIAIEPYVSMTTIALLSFGVVIMAAIALLVAKTSPVFLIMFVVCQGAGYGVTSITRPAITAQLLGRQGFGAISGTIAIPFITAFALGPTLAAAVWSWHNYDAVIWMMMLAAGIGLALLFTATRLQSKA